MKQLFFAIAFLLSLVSFAGDNASAHYRYVAFKNGKPYTVHVVEFPADGHLLIIGQSGYAPGDVIQLRRGSSCPVAKTIGIFSCNGERGNEITLTDYPSEGLYLNNSAWNNESYASGLVLEKSSHWKITASSTNYTKFVIQGSTQTGRANSFGVQIMYLSSNVELSYLYIRDGGTGVQYKTEVEAWQADGRIDSLTWCGRSKVSNLYFHHLKIRNTANEAMYMGSTAQFRHIKTGYVEQKNFCSELTPDTVTNYTDTNFYKQPIIYDSVKVMYNDIDSCALDAIQFGNVRVLEVAYNAVQHWSLVNAEGHKAGLLLGTDVYLSNVHDNTFMHSPNGHGLWHYASGPGHVVTNNLWYDFAGYMMHTKGGLPGKCDNDYHVTYTNNTWAKNVWGEGMRISGQMGGTMPQTFNNNLIIEVGATLYGGAPAYFYLENGGQKTEGTGSSANGLFTSIAAAGLNADNYLQPTTSLNAGKGYIRSGVIPPVDPAPSAFPKIKRGGLKFKPNL